MQVRGHPVTRCSVSWPPLGPPRLRLSLGPQLDKPAGFRLWFGVKYIQHAGEWEPCFFAGRLVEAVAKPAGLLRCHQLQVTAWHIAVPRCCTLLWWQLRPGVPPIRGRPRRFAPPPFSSISTKLRDSGSLWETRGASVTLPVACGMCCGYPPNRALPLRSGLLALATEIVVASCVAGCVSAGALGFALECTPRYPIGRRAGGCLPHPPLSAPLTCRCGVRCIGSSLGGPEASGASSSSSGSQPSHPSSHSSSDFTAFGSARRPGYTDIWPKRCGNCRCPTSARWSAPVIPGISMCEGVWSHFTLFPSDAVSCRVSCSSDSHRSLCWTGPLPTRGGAIFVPTLTCH